MRGVGRVVVLEHDVLLVLAALDNLRRARHELVLDLPDNWQNKWSDLSEHPLSRLGNS